MPVKPDVKDRRRKIRGEYILREYERTGRTAYEQWLDSIAGLAPVHVKINRRAEKERARIPWQPGQTEKEREHVRELMRKSHGR